MVGANRVATGRGLPMRPVLAMSRVAAGVVLAATALATATAPASAERPSILLPDGTPTTLERELATDRATLVVFSTLWCEICRRDAPDLHAWAVRNETRARTLVVLSGSGPEQVTLAVPDRHLFPPVVAIADPEGELADRFRVSATPTYILLDLAGEETSRATRRDSLEWPSSSSESAPVPVSDSGQELGTSYDVTLLASPDDLERAERDLTTAREVCRRLETQLSEWLPDSDVSRLNRNADGPPLAVSEDLLALLRGALHVSRITSGAFDVTWKPLGELWDRAQARGSLPTSAEIDSALAAVGSEQLEVLENGVRFRRGDTRIGVAGVGKGWIIDAVFLHLRSLGWEHVIVNIGGDLRASGLGPDGRPHHITMLDPYETDRSAGTLEVRDRAVATSGNYFRTRTIGDLSVGHIVDPRTGHPPAFDGSVTVLTRDAAMADALATAMFVLGPDEGLALARQLEDVEVVYVTREGLRSSASHDVLRSESAGS